MIAALSPTSQTVLRVLTWPVVVVLCIMFFGGLFLQAARIAKIEGRSYVRAMLIAALAMAISWASQFGSAKLGFSWWAGAAIGNVLSFLPAPHIFKASIPRSLLAYVIALVMAGLIGFIFAEVLIAVRIPLPE
jgi:hypothetical protein